jgi:signal transduction histidine kinase
MLIGIRGAREVLHSDPQLAGALLAKVDSTGQQGGAELRRLLAVLRGTEDTAQYRPPPTLTDLNDLVADYRAAGLPVQLSVTGTQEQLPSGVELSILRIVQEALTNALRHAHPRTVTVALAFGKSALEIRIENDGAAGPQRPTSGHGIIGMRERVALLGGQLTARRCDDGRFQVCARLPIGGST